MRNWKRIAATVLATTMMVSSTMTISYADEAPQNGWVYNEEDSVWNLYRNGKMMVSSLSIEKTNAYYLGADGDMAAGEILHLYHKADDDGALGNVFEVYYEDDIPKYVNKKGIENDVPEDQRENITTVYAKPDGRLAKNDWIILNDGEVAYNEDDEDSAWYYFGDNENTENVWGNGIDGSKIFNAYEYQMVVDQKFKQGGKKYLMDEDGQMFRADWYKGKEEGSIPEEEYRYYSYFGNMVQGKKDADENYEFRYLNGKWFAFKEDGTPMNVIFTDGGPIEESGELSAFENYTISLGSEGKKMQRLSTVNDVVYTGSNAELVYEIVDEDTWKDIKAGNADDEWMSIIFDIDLASPANASVAPQLDARFHDIYVKRDLSDNNHPGMMTGGVKAKLGTINAENNTIEVKFAAGTTGTTWVTLYVDGIEETVAVHSVLPSDENAATESAKTIINTVFDSTGSGLETDNVEGLKSLVEENELIADTLLDNMVDYSDDVANLESSYSMINGITTTNQTSDAASELLGGGDVTVVGAALNMDGEGVAAFNVDEADTMGMEEDYKNTVGFDYTLTLGGEEETEFSVPVVITTPIPEGMDGNEVEVYHSHDGGTPTLVENVTVNESEGTLSFAVNKFSTFIFAQGLLDDGDDNTDDDNTGDNNIGNEGGVGTDPTPAPESSKEDNEPAYTKDYLASLKAKEEAAAKEETVAGQWIQSEKGWLFKNEDGSSLVNEWKKLTYNGKTDWYRFNADGYMATGWFTAADGNIYYLNPISNGFQGAMLTGWQLIDGFWYYFNPVDDAIQGAMYRNTTTPDGYQVDANGRWVQ